MLCPSGVTAARWNRRHTFCACARLTRFTAGLCDVNKTHSIHDFLLLSRHKKHSSVGPPTAINSAWCLFQPSRCTPLMELEWLQLKATGAIGNRNRCGEQYDLFLKPQRRKCEPVGRLRVWHIDSFMSSFWLASLPHFLWESWQRARSPPAKLAAPQGLGWHQSLNQTSNLSLCY